MNRLLIICLFFSSVCLAKSTNNLIILTTFSESSIEPVIQQFKQQHPETSVKVLHRRGEAGLRLLEKQAHDIDIVISSSRLAFMPVIEKNEFLPLGDIQLTPSAKRQTQLHQLPDNVTVFACSGYGLMWNTKYLQKHQLDIPDSLESLAQPQYYHHVIMSSPARSGFTHLVIENILQHYGWEQGWKLLLQIGGNLASVSARSFGVNDAVSRGLAGIGIVLDNFASQSSRQFPFIGFRYQENSPHLPSYIAALKNTHQAKNTLAFIEFMLSEPVQSNMLEGSVHKHNLTQAEDMPFAVKALDHQLIAQRDVLVMQLFEQVISHQLVSLNQAWQLLHKISQLDSLTEAQRQQYKQAQQLASTPPISEEQAESSNYFNQLTMSPSDVFTARQTNDWRTAMAKQLEQSIRISELILASAQKER
ncbi:ABC transporter substrate-binding protein [Photobacterium sp. J15]|uniref:ABC transporter substrate-binding protein n=1 Tax=Photobacterium sp. J15 TaxID=265901 RepID=UPI0007E2F208|nr:ABC transporter substrate-binding protein [Photobacterium sp. J15]